MKYYLTTPIYYVNAAPHLGTAYSTFAADLIKRFKKMEGYHPVVLTTGSDEHSLKVERAAQAAGTNPLAYTTKMAAEFISQWAKLGIDYDHFIRTSDPKHHETVRWLFERCQKNGYRFDLVAISGGKALRGPQATGLLLGGADLVAAAGKAISPHEGIGRGMKVGKEEIIGLLAAVERYLTLDHDAEFRLWEEQAADLVTRLATIHGLSVRREVPEIANHAPHVMLEWSARHGRPTAEEVSRRLLEGDPPIALLVAGERALRIAVWTLQADEHQLVADRLHALFV